MTNRAVKYRLNINWMPVLLFLIAILTWRGAYYRLSLYAAIPMLILFSFIGSRKDIFRSKYWIPYLLLVIWMLLSSLFNNYQAESMRMMIPVFGAFLLSFSVYAIALKGDNSKFLYLSYCLFFFLLLYMSYTKTGFIQDFDYLNEAERESNTTMDANEYAYYSFFLVMSLRMLYENRKNNVSKFIVFLSYVFLAIISAYVALLTASRQVLLLNIPLLLIFIFNDFIKGGRNGMKVFFIILSIAILAVGLPIFMGYYNNSFLATRSQVSFSEDGRSTLMKNAMAIAFQNPIFGIGIGSPVAFSHCTYTHLASRCGFPALIFFIIMLLKFVASQFSKWRRTKDSTYFLFFVCGLFYVIGNFLYSYIDGPFMMAILFIFIGNSERYEREIKQNFALA